jgi:hypothetical protein
LRRCSYQDGHEPEEDNMAARGSKRLLIVAAFGAAVAVGALALRAADHGDSPAAAADPTADITDLFAWMNGDATKVNLVMDLYPNAPTTAKFSDSVLYTFHVTSKASFGATTGTATDITCSFTAAQIVSCWVGTADFVTGDASAVAVVGDGGAGDGAATGDGGVAVPTGITSASGKTRVFAGVRDDPFFFNIDGYHAVVAAVEAAAPSLTFDVAGCPAVDATTSMTLVNQLKTAPDGSAAKNFFAGFNVLALVVQIDKTLVNSGGSILSVWASTNHKS